MKAKKFVQKWSQIKLKESATAQSHFNDLCALVDHKTPLEADPKGEFFTFEEPTEKISGDKGRADVWYRDKFILEYKGYHKNLDKAYQQLQLYRESLGNPPLLITSDTHKIIIHTNFTGRIKQKYTIKLKDIFPGQGKELLERAFNDPWSFKPEKTQEQVTKASADKFVGVAAIIQKWDKDTRGEEKPERIAHFIIRLLFSMFAEDLGILPNNVYTKLVSYKMGDIEQLTRSLGNLFSVMREGGDFGHIPIPNFDGGLFDDDFVPDLHGNIHHGLRDAARLNWAGIDPSIFGTLFERIIDESKRAQLGAHYTSKEDIMLIVEPVLMRPLRDEWQKVKQETSNFIADGNLEKAHNSLLDFSVKISSIRVLDPACGCGNFLYVALHKLLDLQKQVITFAGRKGLDDIQLTVSPEQLFGIEINNYAFELAQITVWIGYLQWRYENGFPEIEEPILRRLHNIELKDALLDYDEKGRPIKAVWPTAEVIIGNPPFLGSRKMRPYFGDQYCDELLTAYKDRIEGMPDLVCYWFDQADFYLEHPDIKRVGLLATQAIRGGANRKVLDRIIKNGNIFMAWSDQKWILEGAMVHVSIIGFDRGMEKRIFLDGRQVSHINSDLTSEIDLSRAVSLDENRGYSFQGVVLRGAFNIPREEAMKMIAATDNPGGESNKDVIKPRRTGADVTRRPKDEYVIDFGVDTPIELAEKYEKPFKYLEEHVYPKRSEAKQVDAREKWWLHWNPRGEMRKALSKLDKYIATPRIAKHRIFVWLDSEILPDAQLVVFARDDDYFFGILHSKNHELWSRRMGTQLREAESGFRYTSRTTFQTFPFPWPPGQEPAENEQLFNVAQTARTLVEFRQSWLNPPAENIGVTISKSVIKKRTITNLYNALVHYRENVKGKIRNRTEWNIAFGDIIDLEDIEHLDQIHDKLDQAVIEVYGWPQNISNEQILAKLLNLNNERSLERHTQHEKEITRKKRAQ